MGVPVIASDIAPHRQFSAIGGVVYFNPKDLNSLETAMRRLADPIENGRLRSSIRFDKIPMSYSDWARSVRSILESETL
jgi:hypothetical protein